MIVIYGKKHTLGFTVHLNLSKNWRESKKNREFQKSRLENTPHNTKQANKHQKSLAQVLLTNIQVLSNIQVNTGPNFQYGFFSLQTGKVISRGNLLFCYVLI